MMRAMVFGNHISLHFVFAPETVLSQAGENGEENPHLAMPLASVEAKVTLTWTHLGDKVI